MSTDQERFEALSALVDGQLQGQDFATAVEMVANDEQARATWGAYHLVGDVLRHGELAACGSDSSFARRLRMRLQTESISLEDNTGVELALSAMTHSESANDASFRWKLVAGFASVTAMLAVAWALVASPTSPLAGAMLARNASPEVATSMVTASTDEQRVMIRDARLDELLAAHKQFGGTTALQMPTGFLRNATFEAPAR